MGVERGRSGLGGIRLDRQAPTKVCGVIAKQRIGNIVVTDAALAESRGC
jgi:hypothetical protein